MPSGTANMGNYSLCIRRYCSIPEATILFLFELIYLIENKNKFIRFPSSNSETRTSRESRIWSVKRNLQKQFTYKQNMLVSLLFKDSKCKDKETFFEYQTKNGHPRECWKRSFCINWRGNFFGCLLLVKRAYLVMGEICPLRNRG